LLAATIAPNLSFSDIIYDDLKVYRDEEGNEYVFDDLGNLYLVSRPWNPTEPIIFLSIDTEKEYEYNTNTYSFVDKPIVYTAGLGVFKLFSKILKKLKNITSTTRVASVLARIKNIRTGKKILYFNRKKGIWTAARDVSFLSLVYFGLSQGGKVATQTVSIAVSLIGLKMFMNFICEEAIQAASMGLFIGSSSEMDAETLRMAIHNFDRVYAISEDVIMYANDIPILQEMQTPFVAFLTGTKGSRAMYEKKVEIKEKIEVQNKAGKRTGVIYIYTNVPAKIYIDGLYSKQYAPGSVKVSAEEHEIILSAVGYINYVEKFKIEEYGIHKIGSTKEPIIMVEERRYKIPDEEKGTRIKGKCIDVYDGDTFTLRVQEKIIERGFYIYQIRLYGVDAPEKARKGTNTETGASSSMRLLSWLIEKEEIEVDVMYIDKYNRVVGEVWMKGECINILLLRVGAVRAYEKYLLEKDIEQYKEEEESAKLEKKGIWRYPVMIKACEEMYKIKGVTTKKSEK